MQTVWDDHGQLVGWDYLGSDGYHYAQVSQTYMQQNYPEDINNTTLLMHDIGNILNEYFGTDLQGIAGPSGDYGLWQFPAGHSPKHRPLKCFTG